MAREDLELLADVLEVRPHPAQSELRKRVRAVLDLDAKRAARAEAKNEPHPVILGGEEFVLPAELPLESIDLMAEGKFRPAFALVFEEDPEATPAGGEETARFFKHRPTDGDLQEIMGLYAAGPESLASPASSPSIGNGLRPTGRRTTTGTSRKTATARPISEPESS